MSPDESPQADTADGSSAARLKTVLLTDICDSTAIVEKLGDAHAADLFRNHDRLVLRLQHQWHGRLIDRSDGLLMLFERPVEGVGFALDYLRGLDELGRVRDIRLTARAGLHVGEVLTWHNSEEAVLAGAKPVDVEGLAKPMAARLMALARPGQMLLSAVAESLASRAASELERDGRHLVWSSVWASRRRRTYTRSARSVMRPCVRPCLRPRLGVTCRSGAGLSLWPPKCCCWSASASRAGS